MLLRLIPALAAALALTVSVSAQAPTDGEPLRGAVDVAGEVRRFTYHFDHNRLTDVVWTGRALIALTRSGDLLHIGIEPFRLEQQAIVRGRGTTLSLDDEGAVLLGTETGLILIVDPDSLGLTQLARVEGPVTWVARSDGRLIAVSHPIPSLPPAPGEVLPSAESRASARPDAIVSVWDSSGVRAFPLPERLDVSSFYIDRSKRLWLGGDLGEFGGTLAHMDLDSGHVTELDIEHGVGGFVETSAGLFVYGGLSHLVCSNAFVAAVFASRVQPIHKQETCSSARTPTAEPVAPIMDVAVEDGDVHVLSGGVLYRSDPSFSSWRRARELSAWNLIDGFSADRESFAIGREGVLKIDATAAHVLSFAGQPAPVALEIVETRFGLVFLTHDGAVRLGASGWTAETLCPEQLTYRNGDYVRPPEAQPLVDDDLGLVVLCEEPVTPGRRALVRLQADRTLVVLDEWHEGRSDPLIGDIFQAPDGTWLALDPFVPTLHAREGTAWRPDAGVGPAQFDFDRASVASGRHFVPLWQRGRDESLLWRGAYGDILHLTRQQGRNWRLVPVAAAGLAHVWDAVRDGDDAILVVTADGIRRYRPETGAVESVSSPPDDSVRSVTRDSLGRLWALGQNLHISLDDGRTWSPVDLPMLSSSALRQIRPFPASPGAVVFSLGDRGVVSIE